MTYSYDNVGNIKITAVASVVPKGDLDYDGIISIKDIILALKLLSGQDILGVSASADIDNDKHIGLSEVIYTLL